MDEWKCANCGYEHKGDQVPDPCPVCGAKQESFTSFSAMGQVPTNKRKPASAPAPAGAEGSTRRWKCTVCGYVHTGSEPPEKCPVCGADRSKFVLLEDEPAAALADPELSALEAQPAEAFNALKPLERYYRWITDKLVDLHAHPISVHIPNGVAPVAVFFALLGALSGSPAIERVAMANMVVVLLAMPFVLFSGYNDWQQRFGGHMTRVFQGKLICGGFFTVLSFWIVTWRFFKPEIMVPGSAGRWFYILLHLGLVATGAIAGYLGGRLVFGNLSDSRK